MMVPTVLYSEEMEANSVNKCIYGCKRKEGQTGVEVSSEIIISMCLNCSVVSLCFSSAEFLLLHVGVEQEQTVCHNRN